LRFTIIIKHRAPGYIRETKQDNEEREYNNVLKVIAVKYKHNNAINNNLYSPASGRQIKQNTKYNNSEKKNNNYKS